MNRDDIDDWRAVVDGILDDLCPMDRLRPLRDSEGPGWDPQTWHQLIETGMLFAHLPTSLGGGGGDLAAGAVAMEAAGRRLIPEPITSCFVASTVVARGGGHPDIDIADSGTRVTLGMPMDDGLAVLDPDGAAAVVVVSPEGGVGLISGAKVTRRGVLVDGRRIGHLPDVGCGAPLSDDGVSEATIGVAAELLGVASAAIDLTIDYLKLRTQFGQKLSTFQALRHRISRLVIERTLTRAVIAAAVKAPSPLYAAAAKARAGALALEACRQGIQLHGGIGMTDEADIGLYYKRACVLDQVLGDTAYHRERFGRLHDYKSPSSQPI